MSFKEFISEELKIVKKNWKLVDNSNSGYTIEINDSKNHSIIDRIKDRTEIKLNDMNTKLQKGVDLIIKKLNKGFFKRDVSYVELTYKESKFKVIFMIKPKSKYIRISSIFELSYTTDNAFIWDINEFIFENPEFEHIKRLTEKNQFISFCEDIFNAEINERTNSFDVYVSDINDVIKLNIEL